MLATVIPIEDFDTLAAKRGGHVLPDPLGAITDDHHAPQDGLLAAAVGAQPAPVHDVQGSASRRLGPQAWRKLADRLTCRHVTGIDQFAVLPTTRQAQFDLMPLAVDQRAV